MVAMIVCDEQSAFWDVAMRQSFYLQIAGLRTTRQFLAIVNEKMKTINEKDSKIIELQEEKRRAEEEARKAEEVSLEYLQMGFFARRKKLKELKGLKNQ